MYVHVESLTISVLGTDNRHKQSEILLITYFDFIQYLFYRQFYMVHKKVYQLSVHVVELFKHMNKYDIVMK